MEEKKCVQSLIRKSHEKRPLGRRKYRWD